MVVGDIGGNTTKVVAYDAADISISVYSYKESCGLSGGITKGSQACVLKVMDQMAQLIEGLEKAGHRVFHIVAATAPCRNKDGEPSKSGLKLAASINDRTGLNVKILKPEKEAYYVGKGLISQHPGISCVVFDTGGGSTEFVLIENGVVKSVYSIPLGMISIPAMKQEPRALIRQHLATLPKELIRPDLPLVASGGVFRNIVESFVNATGDNPEALQSLARLFAHTQTLAFAHDIPEELKTLFDLTGVKKKRGPQLPIAAVLLSEIRHVLQSESTISCISTMRQGIAAEIIEQGGLRAVPQPTPSLERRAA